MGLRKHHYVRSIVATVLILGALSLLAAKYILHLPLPSRAEVYALAQKYSDSYLRLSRDFIDRRTPVELSLAGLAALVLMLATLIFLVLRRRARARRLLAATAPILPTAPRSQAAPSVRAQSERAAAHRVEAIINTPIAPKMSPDEAEPQSRS